MKKINRQIKKVFKKIKSALIILLLLLVTILVGIYTIGAIPTTIITVIALLFIAIFNMFRKTRKTKKGRKKIRNYIFIFIALIGIIGIAISGAFIFYIVQKAPNFKPENLYKKEATIIYDNKNTIITKLGLEKREKISYDDLPQVLIDAVIATEDARYYQHNGFDLPRFLKASLGQATGNRGAGGASTLSMQIIKNYFTSTDQSILRKFTDIYLAIFKLEKRYTKEQILEFYVNLPYLGGGSYGVEQACRAYFGKPVKDINLAEASLIAGMFQAPRAYDPFLNPERTEARRRTVLYLMKKHGYISQEEEQIANSIPVKSLLNKDTTGKTGEFQGYIDTVVEEVREKTGYNPYNVPMKIYTNMDVEKQRYINQIMNGEKYKFVNDVIQTGIAIVSVEDSKILAIGANRNLEGERNFNFATMIERQPGSSIKPFFDYGPGMEYNNWSTYTPFLDEEYSYSNGTKIGNWDGKYMGLMTMRDALGASRNIPALKAFQSVDNKKILEFVQNVGLKPEIESGRIHEAHSIGGYNGASPVQLAGAYAALGNGGYYSEPYSVHKIEYRDTGNTQKFSPKKQRVISDSTAFMLTDILQESVDSGFNKSLKVSGVTVAAKSGTTNYDDKTKQAYKLPKDAVNDAWVVGYSPDYVISFWYGYEKISNKYYSTTNSGFTQRSALFKAIANGIFEKNNKQFEVPKSVIKMKVEKETIPAMLPSEYTPGNMIVTEYFKKGTEPTEVSPRFNKITSNVTNLNVTHDTTTNRFVLTWDKVSTPSYLTNEYFKTNYLSTYGTKYINKYFTKYSAYNNGYLGTFGYNIYSKNNATGGLTFITFTENNTFSESATQASKTYVVKTGFSLLKENQSNGSEITITTNVVDPVITVELYGDTIITIPIGGTYNKYPTEVIVLENSINVTSQATITETITRLSDNAIVTTINTSAPETYQINYSVKYGTITESVNRVIIIE